MTSKSGILSDDLQILGHANLFTIATCRNENIEWKKHKEKQ